MEKTRISIPPLFEIQRWTGRGFYHDAAMFFRSLSDNMNSKGVSITSVSEITYNEDLTRYDFSIVVADRRLDKKMDFSVQSDGKIFITESLLDSLISGKWIEMRKCSVQYSTFIIRMMAA